MGFFRVIGAFLSFVFTGGRYGKAGPVKSRYAKNQEQRAKDFAEYGGHPCKICGTRIPANKHYCAPCWVTYRKK